MSEPLNYEGPLPDDVVSRVAAFLETPIRTDGDWLEITEEDWKELHLVIQDIIEAKFQRDCDGDHTVEYALCNRKLGRLETIQVPYHTETDADMEKAMFAISRASGIVENMSRTMSFTLGERRRTCARVKRMQPVLSFLNKNGAKMAYHRVEDYITGERQNLFIGRADDVWEPLGLTCSELNDTFNEYLGRSNLYQKIDQLLLDAVRKMEETQ